MIIHRATSRLSRWLPTGHCSRIGSSCSSIRVGRATAPAVTTKIMAAATTAHRDRLPRVGAAPASWDASV